MFAASLRRAASLALLSVPVAATAGCFRSTAPRGWLPSAEQASVQAFGSWIVVEDATLVPPARVEGELIAVYADTIHVLAAERLVSVPRPSRCCVTLTAFDMNYAPLVIWGAAGVLSTASHGIGLIITAPIWAIAATSVAANASFAPRVRSSDAEALRPFARFPHGLPPGLDRTTLRPKPWSAARVRQAR